MKKKKIKSQTSLYENIIDYFMKKKKWTFHGFLFIKEISSAPNKATWKNSRLEPVVIWEKPFHFKLPSEIRIVPISNIWLWTQLTPDSLKNTATCPRMNNFNKTTQNIPKYYAAVVFQKKPNNGHSSLQLTKSQY